jgi:hypothetical protein
MKFNLFASKPECSVEIHDVRPLPDGSEPFEPYFAALCVCGWVDVPHDTEGQARAAALEHTAKVEPGLKRPVG